MRCSESIFLSLGCNFFQCYLHEFLRILIFPRFGQNQVSSRPPNFFNHSNRRSSASWVDPAYFQVEIGPPHLVAKRIACCRQKNWYKTRNFQKMVVFDIFSIDCQKHLKKRPKRSTAEVQIIAFPLGALIFLVAKSDPGCGRAESLSAPHCPTNFIFFSGQKVAQDLAGSSALQLAELLANTLD